MDSTSLYGGVVEFQPTSFDPYLLQKMQVHMAHLRKVGHHLAPATWMARPMQDEPEIERVSSDRVNVRIANALLPSFVGSSVIW